ncbi:MAG: hypothetical protein HXY40_01485 [Chloroflexi bacterium]|nr:hypothetical protein [Chloroflexota bacterium]
MKALRTLVLLLALFALLLAACTRGQTLEDLPTPVNPDTYPTEVFLTQNAPPAGFSTIAFPQVDLNLNRIAGWRYEVLLSFEGVFASTPRQTSASARAQVWFNQLGSARRVVLVTTGELIGQGTQDETTTIEGVRLGPDSFLVRAGVCLTNAGEDAARAADLSAGGLIGGITSAVPTGRQAVLNGVQAWQYQFSNDALVLPNIRPAEGGSIAMSAPGEIWVAPAYNAIVRFYVTLDVQNAILFDRQLPVSGQVIIRFDLYEIGVAQNISVPFGC